MPKPSPTQPPLEPQHQVEKRHILPTKETRCRQNSQAVRSEIRPRWRRRFAFRALMGSAKVAHSLHLLSFRYRSRGRDATAAICFVGGTPPVYSARHDLILMSSRVLSRERSLLTSLSLCLPASAHPNIVTFHYEVRFVYVAAMVLGSFIATLNPKMCCVQMMEPTYDSPISGCPSNLKVLFVRILAVEVHII
jgi:hypothetical protein